jgi:hypothetical protein
MDLARKLDDNHQQMLRIDLEMITELPGKLPGGGVDTSKYHRFWMADAREWTIALIMVYSSLRPAKKEVDHG